MLDKLFGLPKNLRYPLVGLLWIILALLFYSQFMVFWGKATTPNYVVDVGIFRDAGIAWLHHAPLYGPDFISDTMSPFVYPPIAALLFVPLAWLSSTTTQIIWMLAVYISVWLMLYFANKRLDARHPILFATMLLPVAAYFMSFRVLQELGQLDAFLYALVMADILGFIPRKFRGIGVGIAAALKMTPAVWGLFFLFRKDWASVIRSAVTFLATVVIGFIIYPSQSTYFWSKLAFDSTRATSPHYERDQSIRAMLTRSFFTYDQMDMVKPFLFLFGFGLAAVCAWFFIRKGNEVLAYFTLFLGLMLFQPVANYHHWIGAVVALSIFFVYKGTHSWAARISGVLVSIGLILAWLTVYIFHIDFTYWLARPVALNWLMWNIVDFTAIIAFIILVPLAFKAEKTNV
ncbi:MAG: glycosyltransferase 87 family protein [Corynebacterium sp.]|nr:glycosyltransferase 87 family protein [Corynebacterium sp.]